MPHELLAMQAPWHSDRKEQYSEGLSNTAGPSNQRDGMVQTLFYTADRMIEQL